MSRSPGRCPLSRGPLSAAMSQEKPKERVKREKDHINPKVSGQDGSRVQFKIKRHALVRKLMKASCQRQGLSMRQIRFRFDGQPANETDTPAKLEMDDENTTDVFQQQTGGRGAPAWPAASPGRGRPLEPPSPRGAGPCLLSNSACVAKPVGRQARTLRTFSRRTLL